MAKGAALYRQCTAPDEQLVLEHVRRKQEALADLVEGGADRQVEDHQRGMEAPGLAAGERGSRGQPGAERAGEHGPEPAEDHEAAGEPGFVMPVTPVDHWGRRFGAKKTAAQGRRGKMAGK